MPLREDLEVRRSRSWVWVAGAVISLIALVLALRGALQIYPEPGNARSGIASSPQEGRSQGERISLREESARVELPKVEVPGVIRGTAVLQDGFPLMNWPLRLIPSRANGLNATVLEGIGLVTDHKGRFEFFAVPPGLYHVRSAAPGVKPGTAEIELSPSDKDVTVVFRGYRVALQCIDGRGVAVHGAIVSIGFEPLGQQRPHPIKLAIKVDERGVAEWIAPSTGDIHVQAVATDGALASEGLGYAIRDGSSFLVRRIVLYPIATDGMLAISVVCRETGQEGPYLAKLRDPLVDAIIRTLQWEDADSEGIIRGLPTGSYELQLHKRFAAPFSMYMDGQSPSQALMVTHDEVARVVFRVPCGGRLRVRAYDASGYDSTGDEVSGQTASVKVTLIVGSAEKRLAFILDEGGDKVVIGASAPLGQTVVTRDVLTPGQYDVLMHAEGYEQGHYQVRISPGQLTELQVPMIRR